jgi:deoxyribonuclease-4
MYIGAHISAAGDVSLAPQRAKDIGCECFQFFSRPPQGGKAKEITPEIAKNFKVNMKEYGQFECYIHSPYYINLASLNNRIYHGSISVIRQELERGSLLGVKYMMIHLGSYREAGEKKGIAMAVEGLKKVLDDYTGETKLLVEMSAGAGSIIGDTYEEIDAVINSAKLKKYNIGICFDTAHGFASGYDLSSEKAVKKTFSEFNKKLGFKNLKLIHANDSKVELNTKKDRHEHIGKGFIGVAGFQAIVDFAKAKKINLILETPADDSRIEDVKILKKMRDKK